MSRCADIRTYTLLIMNFSLYSNVSKLVEDSEFNLTIPDVYTILKPDGSKNTDVLLNVRRKIDRF